MSCDTINFPQPGFFRGKLNFFRISQFFETSERDESSLFPENVYE